MIRYTCVHGMEQAIFDFYSKPVTHPLYWQLKSALGRRARFVIPIVIETVEDVLMENIPIKDALMNNIMERMDINKDSTINKDEEQPLENKDEDDWSAKRACYF